MLILGLSGGLDSVYPPTDPASEPRFIDSPFMFHDAAAVLFRDGEMIAAIEQERLDRIKHSNRFPAAAIRFCLEQAGVGFETLDAVAYYSRERALQMLVGTHSLRRPWERPVWDARKLMVELFKHEVGVELDVRKLRFIDHHTAHAFSASALAPFEQSLVITLDGQGDGLSGTVFEGRRLALRQLAELPKTQSLGGFYAGAIAFLGYRQFDEYKVMGLAPYGNPERFRPLLRQAYSLEPEGRFRLDPSQLALLVSVGPPRRRGEPFTQEHKDIAAALQASLEEIVLHHVAHYQKLTGQRRLCFAGGLAHNCTLNGRLLRSGLFDEVFVQPVAHDAGCALGAALGALAELRPQTAVRPLTHLYWGTPTPTGSGLEQRLERWGEHVTIRRLGDKAAGAAELMAAGEAIGWVQGRSELGPRALGNRSILADPRPAANKDLINAMVKKREGYRPFAPMVQEEHAAEYFEIPAGKQLPFMIFVVGVRESARALLGATTHVDGTARIQTVSRAVAPELWELLEAFRQRTGVPVLLNTSFNNHREPIVDSVDDAVVCLLTTGLQHVVIGDFLIEKKPPLREALLGLCPALPRHVQLLAVRQATPLGFVDRHSLLDTGYDTPGHAISTRAHAVLRHADGRTRLGALLASAETTAGFEAAEREALLDELRELWTLRLIALWPQ